MAAAAFLLPAFSACAAQSDGAAASGLRIPTYQGEVIYRDSATCDVSECRRYTLAGHLSPRYQLVRAEEAAVVVFFAVDRLGGEIRVLNGPPRLNPARTAFITLSFDEMDGTLDKDGTFIWSVRENGEFALDRHFAAAELAAPEFVRWVGADCAEVRGFRGWGTNRPGNVATYAIRRAAGAEWQLSDRLCSQ